MTDDVLCVRVSPNGKLLAASLLDSTVRVRVLVCWCGFGGATAPRPSWALPESSTCIVS